MKDKKIISLAHGSGGKLTHNLIKNLFLREFKNPKLQPLTDSAVLSINGISLAFTTDTYTVKPIFFPGCDIGKLAVCGTINDLVVMGAKPLYLSCALVIEEGLKYHLLEKIISSMKKTAENTGIEIVTGDTKVVEKGKGDEVFINTSGIGIIDNDSQLSHENIKVGDKVILNGPIGDHGIAVLSSREEFGLQTSIESDCAPLNGLVSEILSLSPLIRFMRDPTRGGLATTLNEVVEGKDFGIILEEDQIPVRETVKAICEILGFDPLYIANEGKVVLIVAEKDASRIVEKMRTHPLGKESRIIGEVVTQPIERVCLRTLTGGTRIVDMMVGDQLPRIC
jgi:hydrogenase expression/formation protein HypE